MDYESVCRMHIIEYSKTRDIINSIMGNTRVLIEFISVNLE